MIERVEKLINEFRVEKSKFPDNEGNYILYHHSETIHGECWRRIMKGTKKDCLAYKKKLINGKL